MLYLNVKFPKQTITIYYEQLSEALMIFPTTAWWGGRKDCHVRLANICLLRVQPIRAAVGLLASSPPNPIMCPGIWPSYWLLPDL